MLTVRTFVAPSQIHGLGVFAAEPIPAGMRVWVLNDVIDVEITPEELDTLPATAREIALIRSFINDDGRLILSRDNAVFFNHADSPNTMTTIEGNIAIRDIAIGEELTEDYRNFPEGACNEFLRR